MFNLTIYIPERYISIIVTEEVGNTFNTEWKAWKANVARNESDVFEIHGLCDTSDRAERTLTVEAESIRATDLYRM